jgi:Flp pilus assembly pilin Flp
MPVDVRERPEACRDDDDESVTSVTVRVASFSSVRAALESSVRTGHGPVFAACGGMGVHLSALLRDDRGQDLTEYGLLASLIAVVVAASVGNLGSAIAEWWTRIVAAYPF